VASTGTSSLHVPRAAPVEEERESLPSRIDEEGKKRSSSSLSLPKRKKEVGRVLHSYLYGKREGRE